MNNYLNINVCIIDDKLIPQIIFRNIDFLYHERLYYRIVQFH